MGAAQGEICSELNRKTAYIVGREIARMKCILVTGATTGLPHEACLGAKSAKGLSIGISPARTRKEHMIDFDKPVDATDAIIFTGYGYAARNVLNIRSSDAVIILPGGMGTMTEFSVAYEEGKIIGVLAGSGGIADTIPKVIDSFYRKSPSVLIYESDPRALVKKVINALNEAWRA